MADLKFSIGKIMEKIIIFGTGQTAEIVYKYFEKDKSFEVVAFTADRDFIKKERIFDLPVVPFDTILNKYPINEYKMFVAIGYKNLNKLRAEKYNEAKNKGYQLVNYIDKDSGINPDIVIGDNCLVLENQSIQPFSEIGSNVFVWGSVVIAHHSTIANHCWITSGVSIAGNTKIGDFCFIGINATIGHMVQIGRKCFIGAGAIITKSAEDNSVFIEKETEKFALDSSRFIKLTKMG